MIRELHLAWRYLFRGRARHISFIGIVSCLGVAVGVATLIVVISVMNGFSRELMNRLMRFNYHITVESFSREDLPPVKEAVSKWEGVENASLFLQTQVFVKFDRYVFPVMVKGVDFTDQREKKFFYKYVTEDTQEEGFFAGEGLRRRLHGADRMEFYPLRKKLKLLEGKIRGTFKVDMHDADNNFLVSDLKAAQELSENYILLLGIRVDDPFKARELKERIQRQFPQGVFPSTWIESNRNLYSAIKLEKVAMFVILSFIILVASFNIFATVTVRVVEKTKDIGILKATGYTGARIARIFSLQGLLLGIIGVVFGTSLGVGICLLLQKYPLITLPGDMYFEVDYLPVALNYFDIVLIGAVGVGLSFVSGLVPAIRGGRMSACDALRYE